MFRNFTVLLAACTVLAACTGSSNVPDNSLSIPLRINLKTLDPAQASDEATSEVMPQIFESLLQYHYLKRPLEVIPLLSDGMPKVSKDGLTVTIKIKPGIKFQDSEVFPGGKGREVVADDFIYSWKRVADTATKGDGFWIFDGKIVGINEWRDKLSKGQGKFDDAIAGLQAPDAHTLVIKLTQPYYQLEYILTMPYTSVVPKEAVAKYGQEFMNHPLGTGPYLFESWIRGNKVVLKRNPTWHGETYPTEGGPGDKEAGLLADAGKPLPFVDKIIINELPEDQPRWLNLLKGATDLSQIPKDNYDSAIENKTQLKAPLAAKGMTLQVYPWPEVTFIGFNMDDPILGKNANLRKALALAWDSNVALEKFYNWRGVAAQSPIPPDVDGYDENFKNPWKQFNVEKAKEMLKKAGYPDGKGLPVLEYNINSSPTSRQFAEFDQQQFAKIGVKINIITNSWPQFQDRIRNKKAQMFGMAWNLDYPDPQNVFQLFYGPNESPGSNNSNFKNKDFDKLYEQSLKLPPGPARTKVYLKMRDLFVEQMPWIPGVHRKGYMVVHGWIQNYKKNATMHGEYKYVKVDLEKKKQLKGKL